MRTILRLLPLLLLFFLLGCANPALMGLPVAQAPNTPAPSGSPPLYQVPADATTTPTPFQPIPPTAVYYPTDTPQPTGPPPASVPKPETGVKQTKLEQPKGQMNILLLGSDKRPWDQVFRTDTIILATVNYDEATVNLTSFPRDLYVTIPGHGMNRINTAWQNGGFDKLAQTMEYNFGVRPDHYVMINFSSFKKVVDSMGGLTVHVKEPLADYYNGRYVSIPAGEVLMDADDVLWYVRSRKTTNDFARSRRQQEILQAIFEKMLSLDALKRVPEFYNLYKESVTTDLGFTDVVKSLPLAAKLTDTSRIHHYYIGPQHVYDWISPGGGMVLLPRPDAIQNVLRKALNLE